MSVLGMTAFSAKDDDRNGLIILEGPVAYDTDVPSDSAANTSLEVQSNEFRRPFYSGEKAAAFREPVGTEYWFHYRVKTTSNNTNNDNAYYGVGRASAEVMGFSSEDNTHLFIIVVAGTNRATAVSGAISVGNWERVHVHVAGHLEGDVISLYQDGDLATPVVTYTLTAGDETALGVAGKPNEFRCEGPNVGNSIITDLFCIDPADGVGGAVNTPANFAECSIEPRTVTGDGFYTDWSGTFADIDEVPASDADFIATSTVDDVSTFTKAATTQDKVLFVQSLWRITRTGTDAGSQVQIRLRDSGGTNLDETITAAPGDGDVIQPHDVGPTGDWNPTRFNAMELGPVART